MPTRQQAEARYREIRTLALADAELSLSGVLPAPVSIRTIDQSALEAFVRSWSQSPDRRVAWPWPIMVSDYRRDATNRFEAAVWSDVILCGLAIGKPSKSGAILTVHFIEGNPELNHPLKGFAHLVALEAAHAYATALKANVLRLREPIPEMIGRYQKLGFRLAKTKVEGSYCEREV